jgi:hypothetical protein
MAFFFGRQNSTVSFLLSAVPMQISAIPIHIAILTTEFVALVPRRAIISVVQITAKLVTVMSDSCLVMVNITPVAPSIVGKHCSCTQPQHQEHSRNRPFHVFILLRTLRIHSMQTLLLAWSCGLLFRVVCVACEPLSARVEATVTQNSNTKPAVGVIGNSSWV